MKRTAGAGIIFAAVFLLVPLATFAQSKPTFLIKPIVPVECRCDNQTNVSDGTILTTAPDFGCVMQVVQNSINHGVSIAAILFVIYMVIAGFAFVTARDSSEALSQAKIRITNVFIGLAVLLLAWLLVDYVMKTLYESNSTFFGPWNTILAQKPDGSDRCIVAKNPSILASGTVTSGSLTSTGGGGGSDESGSAPGGSSGLDKAKAASFLISHYGSNSSSGHGCLAAIQLAFQASGGGSLLCPGQGAHHWAGTCGPLLTSKGYSSLGGSDQSPQVGDIVVVPGNKYSTIGHIAMYTSSGWISDFAQGVNGNPYPSPKPPAQYYRP